MALIRRQFFTCGLLALTVLAILVAPLAAGMPSPLPTSWTMNHTREVAVEPRASSTAEVDVRWQAISFFVVCLLACSAGVRFLWNVLRKDLPWLPRLSFGRSFSFVVLWGLLFVVVLTMISGARELMTPGAWRKQGWTYQLVGHEKTSEQPNNLAARRAALENLRLSLFQYAATHNGRFPATDDVAIDQKLWEVPGWAGLKFLNVSNRKANDSGQLLVFEPETDGDERLVLLTNGVIGSMRTADVTQALAVWKR